MTNQTGKHLASTWALLGKALNASLSLWQDRVKLLRPRWIHRLARAGVKSCAMLAGLALGIASSGAAAAAATAITQQAQDMPLANQQQAVAPRQPAEVERESWRKAILKTPRPKKACFTATYPETEWREVPCKTPPHRPYPPKHGIRPVTVGSGTDFSAQVTGDLSEAEGSFDSVTGVTSECAVPCPGSDFTCPVHLSCGGEPANAYSLQLNTEPFTTKTCKGSPAPKKCQGWEQFVYSSSGGGFIQYWLESYGPGGTACPSGWNTFSFSAGGEVYCWINAVSAAPAPAEAISSLGQMKVTGTVAGVTGPDDSVAVTVGTVVYSAPGDDHFPDLGMHWQIAEFNVFGDGGGDQAVFNNGSTIVVRTSVDSATTSAPISDADGFTGETNNLTLVCNPTLEPGTTTTWPSIKFGESNFDYLYRIPGKLVYLSASPDSNAAWGINKAGEVWRYLGAGTPKNPWQQVTPGKFQQISLGAEFVVWGVNTSADIYQYAYKTGSQGEWKLRMAQGRFPLPNTPGAATWIVNGSVAAASDNTVWAAMTAESVYYPAAPPQFDTFPYRWTGETFKLISFPASPVVSIAVGSSTNVWALGQSGNIYSYTGHDDHPWNNVPGSLVAISAAADGTVWGINQAGQAVVYTGPPPPKEPSKGSHPWRHVPGPGKRLAQISVGSQNSVWALDSEGGAYSYSSSSESWTWWNPSPQCPLGLGNGTLTSISALASGGMWGLNMNTEEIWAYNFEP